MRALMLPTLAAVSLVGCGGGEEAVPFDTGMGASPGGDIAGEDVLREPYPDPPYGTKVGAIMEDFRFLGWQRPMDAGYDPEQMGAVSLASFYDPTGAKGIRYIALTATAVWCSVCRLEYDEFRAGRVESYSSRGVAFMGALFEDNDSRPAQPEDAVAWARNFDVSFPFVLDPGFKLSPFFDKEATPMTMVIDASNMEIIWLAVGWAPPQSLNSLWALLDQLTG